MSSTRSTNGGPAYIPSVEAVEEIKVQTTLFDASYGHSNSGAIKRDLFLATVQIIAMVLAIFGAGSYLSYQNSKLIDQIDKRIEDSNRQMDKRFEQMEKRFEDLKQTVLSDRQQREKK